MWNMSLPLDYLRPLPGLLYEFLILCFILYYCDSMSPVSKAQQEGFPRLTAGKKAQWQDHKAAGRAVCAIRNQRVTNTGPLFALSYPFCPESRPTAWFCSYLGWVFPTSLNPVLETLPTAVLEARLLGDLDPVISAIDTNHYFWRPAGSQ